MKEASQVSGNAVFCHSTMAESVQEYTFSVYQGPTQEQEERASCWQCLIKVDRFLRAVKREHKGPYVFLLHWKLLMALLRLLSCQCLKGCNSMYVTAYTVYKGRKAGRQLKGGRGWKKTCSFNDWHFQKSPVFSSCDYSMSSSPLNPARSGEKSHEAQTACLMKQMNNYVPRFLQAVSHETWHLCYCNWS